MIKYEDCLCDQEIHDASLEIIGAGVVVTYTCRECGNKVYDTNYTLEDVSDYV